MGWQKDRQNNKRVHECLVHIEIINDKIWIRRDADVDGVALELGTAGVPNYGIALELVDAGVPEQDIVAAFHPPSLYNKLREV